MKPARLGRLPVHPAPEVVCCLAGTLVLLLVGALLPGPLGATEEIDAEGILHVKNGATPSQGTETLKLQEAWRAGGDDDEVIFGVIGQVLGDDDGNLYLLDSQLAEVQVFSADGEYLKTLSREGDGPGEVRSPGNMLFLPDGSLGLVQRFPGKVVKIDLEGDPAGELTPGSGDPTAGGFVALADGRTGGGNTVLGCVSISFDQATMSQTRTCYMASFGDDGQETTRFQELSYEWTAADLTMTEQQMFYVWQRWAVAGDGRVLVLASWNDYAVKVYNPDGSVDRIFEREYKSYARTDSDPGLAAFIFDRIKEQIATQGIEGDFVVEKYDPDISGIRVADDGSVWILTSQGSRNQADGIMATFDVFDATGHFTKQVAVPCEGDAVRDGLFFIGDDRLVVVTGFIDAVMMQIGSGAGGGAAAGPGDDDEEPTPMEIICYEIL